MSSLWYIQQWRVDFSFHASVDSQTCLTSLEKGLLGPEVTEDLSGANAQCDNASKPLYRG